MSMKKIQWSHRNRAPDIPACSAVPQSTSPPRVPYKSECRKYFCNRGFKFSRRSKFRLRSSESRRLAIWTGKSKDRGGWPTFCNLVKHKVLLNNTLYKESVSTQRKHTLYPLGQSINPLNPELNPIWYLLALLGAHHFLHVSRIRDKLLTLRRLMSYIYIYIYGAPILDVSRSHTTTQHSR